MPVLPSVHYAITETNIHAIEDYWKSECNDPLFNNTIAELFATEEDHICFIIFMYQWQDDPTLENYHLNFVNKILDNIRSRYYDNNINSFYLKLR